MGNITTVKNFAEMVAIFPKEEGNYYYVVDEKRYYTYNNEEYIPVKGQANTNIEMSLYDMNSQIMAQLPSINLQEKEEVTKEEAGYQRGYYQRGSRLRDKSGAWD